MQSSQSKLSLQVVRSLQDIPAATWNEFAAMDDHNPLLSHAFLYALEQHHCVGQATGWIPHHFVLSDDNDIKALVPAYIKTDSFGEFVFDWAWADAYQQQGLEYYPKLVIGVPFTPATGARILHQQNNSDELIKNLALALQDFCKQSQLSGVHFLFTNESQTKALNAAGYLTRIGCQYHWYNQNYKTFDDFLAQLNSRKRKKINRERRYVNEQDINLEIKHGHELSSDEWQTLETFYRRLYDRKWGNPSLNIDFFEASGREFGDNVVVVFAKYQQTIIACSYMLKSDTTLYGRYWGCLEQYHSLHFETCYYQGIEYAIKHGLQHFEPGAQGEHKIARGFLPTTTYSAHWLAHTGFHQAIDRYLHAETQGMQEQITALKQLSPYRQPSGNQ